MTVVGKGGWSVAGKVWRGGGENVYGHRRWVVDVMLAPQECPGCTIKQAFPSNHPHPQRHMSEATTIRPNVHRPPKRSGLQAAGGW